MHIKVWSFLNYRFNSRTYAVWQQEALLVAVSKSKKKYWYAAIIGRAFAPNDANRFRKAEAKSF